MLKNAMLYKKELQNALIETWYDPKYQYFYGSDWRGIFEMNDDGNRRDFVSVDKDGNLIGYIGYCIITRTRLATDFGIINFTDDVMTFGLDIRTAIDDAFMKFGIETIEFAMICGNPIEKSYDRIVSRAGGQCLCTQHARAQDLEGNLCDVKLYEITRAQYLIATKKIENG